jgi:hypothetical protein
VDLCLPHSDIPTWGALSTSAIVVGSGCGSGCGYEPLCISISCYLQERLARTDCSGGAVYAFNISAGPSPGSASLYGPPQCFTEGRAPGGGGGSTNIDGCKYGGKGGENH